MSKRPISEESIKLIFGLKIKQLRIEKKLSLKELSAKTSISVSYLNEIEKGKKYPKANKITALANALDTEYNYLVSTKLNKRLAPISELLNSNILADLPFNVYGINKGDLIEILSNVPDKLSAFISTIFQIGRSYNMTVENFYFAVLTSYMEMHENYFEEIELAAEAFLREHNLAEKDTVFADDLIDILVNEYKYELDEESLSASDALQELRSVTIPGPTTTLCLNKNLNRKQRAFAIGLEIGFNYLKLKERPYSATWVEINSFEEVLNNFKASYFANAILMNKDRLSADLSSFFSSTSFDSEQLIDIKEKYNATTEMFCSRLTNIMPKFFGLSEFFFLTFNHAEKSDEYALAKEMHFSGPHTPHYTIASENYCRRWKAITILNELEELQQSGQFKRPICRAQISRFPNNNREYLIISFARRKRPSKTVNSSISIGMLINDQLKPNIKFTDDQSITRRLVGNTCERCNISDCAERVAEPILLESELSRRQRKLAVRKLLGKE